MGLTEIKNKSTPKKNMGAKLIKRLYTVKESAEYLGRSAWSIRELIYKGTLPCVKVGRRIHIDINDLEKLIDKHKMRFTY